jgi:hypothetical protein
MFALLTYSEDWHQSELEVFSLFEEPEMHQEATVTGGPGEARPAEPVQVILE